MEGGVEERGNGVVGVRREFGEFWGFGIRGGELGGKEAFGG